MGNKSAELVRVAGERRRVAMNLTSALLAVRNRLCEYEAYAPEFDQERLTLGLIETADEALLSAGVSEHALRAPRG